MTDLISTDSRTEVSAPTVDAGRVKPISPLNRLRRRVPAGQLERRAFALMTDTAANAVLGIVFWAAAARFYTPAEVGRGSAIISAAILLATLSQLNLGNVYARFLGSAAHRQRTLVFTGYGVVIGLALLLGAGYALLGPGHVLFGDAMPAWVFPLCVALLAVFALQDMILVSVQRPVWVPIENILWGLAKLALLVLLATALPSTGVVTAWMLPALIAVVAVTGYLIGRQWVPTSQHIEPFPARRELGKAISGEYITGLVSTAVPLVLPLLVVHQLGLDANAYFAVPWLFATSLSLLMWNIAAILLVEAAAAPDRLSSLLGRALRLSMIIAVGGGLCIWFLGPAVLSILGPSYAEHSTWLLRITSLAAPAIAVVVVWTTANRARGRLRRVVLMQTAIGVGILGLAILMIGPLGVVGIGVAYLTAQSVAALVLIRPLLLMIRPPSVGRHRRPSGVGFTGRGSP